MKLTNIFVLGISLLNISLAVKATPLILAQSSCQVTVNNVIRQIKNKGVSHVKFEISQGSANDSYRGNPTNRDDVLIIILGHLTRSQKEYYNAVNILSSGVLKNAWADDIVKNCGKTAVVQFELNNTDWVDDYAIQENGKTRVRECVSPPCGVLSWNYQCCL